MTDWQSDMSDVENVFAAICDLNGVLRGKRVPPDQLDKILKGDIRMPLSVACVDIWGEDIENSPLVFEAGDIDGICTPTGRGVLPITWTSRPTMLVPLWLADEQGQPFMGDPRRILANVVQRFTAMKLTPVVATELEFYLIDPSRARPAPPNCPVSGRNLDKDGVLALDDLEQFDAFLNDVYDACRLQNIPADSAISENGAGQFEINFVHVADALKAADDAVLFKRIVRGIARKHGLAATFMAKPYGARAGSGLHVHFSLLDEAGANVFDDGGPTGTDSLRHAIAGLVNTMAENALVFAPHENSYRRLTPGAHAPTAVSWGYENRTVAIRVPGGSPKARRIEHRVAGSDANPYLVLAAVLGGALLGLKNKWTPPAPHEGSAYTPDLPQIPRDWLSAIDAFDLGEHVDAIFADQLRKLLVDCKRQEHRAFKAEVSDFEYRTYLEVV